MEGKNLSKGIIQALLRTNKADDNWEVIEQYIIAGGVGVQLTELQERMYERWTFIDEKLRQGKFRRYEIINQVKLKFDVSADTAKRDIVGCEMVFSSTFPLNKKYMIGVRVAFVERQINLAAAANDFKSVQALEQVLQKYIDSYPDTANARSPKQITLNVTQNVINGELLETKDAEIIIEEAIKNGRKLDSTEP